MTFTAPKTWAFQEGVESSELNIHLRDNFLAMGPHLIARKTADQSVASSTALVNDSDLLFAVAANEVWRFEFVLRWDAGAAGDIKISFAIPTSGRLTALMSNNDTGGTPVSFSWDLSVTDGTSRQFGGDGAGVLRIGVINGIFVNAGTAGNVTLRWAQAAADATATIMKAQSTLWAVKLA